MWVITATGLRKLLEESSRGWPDFVTDAQGRQVVRTYWRSEDLNGKAGQKLEAVDWTLANGRFQKSRPIARAQNPCIGKTPAAD